ncbi:phosphatidate cytidylyltransferase [Marinomonas piezotolerans]|uniref:Phosphatidate cytidylyltransferase n=1 Tax=Marinomonas piezotolerans TaxID=2213058 RepID=A0A370UAE3_9GAMM|nr:phosphatidate cytidylyltransferase [Marinomonas piezotolerans]RDL44743.1 phosphatidate cytidylyltransferase [Marinomonas piezotolerans]
MLLPRVLSAMVMAFLFIYAVFGLEPASFELAIGGVVLVAGWEWARLAGIHRQQGRFAFAGLVGTLCYGVALFDLYSVTLLIAPVLWLLALLWVVKYPQNTGWRTRIVRVLFGLLVLLTTWASLVVLRGSEHFVVWVLVLMGMIWGADSGAYFSGRAFGRRKLAPSVSPGKSWEGVYGGLIVVQSGVVIFSVLNGYSVSAWAVLATIALVTVLTSVLGDLTESLFKRHEDLKDSSQLIPGHGGVMDRVDSLTSAAPLYALMLTLVGWL